jgi:sulfite exporter TauE/SafE
MLTAFTIGLFGSIHCVGMCGPIALALPYGQGSKWRVLRGALYYNLGRILTYMALGLLIGVIGQGLALAGWQRYYSILLGALLLVAAALAWQPEEWLIRQPVFGQLYLGLKRRLGHSLRGTGYRAFWQTGLLNGLLPCGLVYLAIAGALNSPGPLWSAAYMALFGLGTFPLMLITISAGQVAGSRLRSGLRKLYPAFLVLLGLLFIYRGVAFYLPADFVFEFALHGAPMCR